MFAVDCMISGIVPYPTEQIPAPDSSGRKRQGSTASVPSQPRLPSFLILAYQGENDQAPCLDEHIGIWKPERNSSHQRRPKRSKLSHGQHGAVPRISRNRTICVAASRELYVRLETLVSSRTLRALSNVRPETCVSSRWF